MCRKNTPQAAKRGATPSQLCRDGGRLAGAAGASSTHHKAKYTTVSTEGFFAKNLVIGLPASSLREKEKDKTQRGMRLGQCRWQVVSFRGGTGQSTRALPPSHSRGSSPAPEGARRGGRIKDGSRGDDSARVPRENPR